MSIFTSVIEKTRAGPPVRSVAIGSALMLAWLLLLALAAEQGYRKLVGISVIACAAMLAGAGMAALTPGGARRLVLADAAGAGAMFASACVFLLPEAIVGHPVSGVLGVVAGLVAGAALHAGIRQAGARAGGLEPSVLALSLHALTAGAVMGMVYARIPALGMSLGVAIVAHKLPAGYAVARNLRRHGQSIATVLWPACAVGFACLPTVMLVASGKPGAGALVFGFATGIFAQVAMVFALPADIREERPAFKRSLWYATIAAAVGAGAVVGLWWLIR